MTNHPHRKSLSARKVAAFATVRAERDALRAENARLRNLLMTATDLIAEGGADHQSYDFRARANEFLRTTTAAMAEGGAK